MAFEITDDQIPFSRQYVSVAILIVNILMFIYQVFDPSGMMHVELAFVPADFFAGEQLWTIFTSMFMHGDIVHIFFNMLFFYVVADNCEDAMGHLYYLLTYLISGVFATFLHAGFALLAPETLNIPTLGASGAIAGIIAVYGLLFPENRLRVLMGYVFLNIRAKHYFIVFLFLQLLYGFLLWGGASTAYFAHLGGFVAGAICAILFMTYSEKYNLSKLFS